MLTYFSFLSLAFFGNKLANENDTLLKSTFADDDNEEEDEDKEDDKEEDDDEDNDDDNNIITQILNSSTNNSIGTTTSNSSTSSNLNTSTTSNQTSQTCSTVYDIKYNTVYDTVTSASGKTSKVAKQVETKVPREVCNTNTSLTSTGNIEQVIVPTKETIITKESIIEEKISTGTLNKEIKSTIQKLFKAPNSKVYSIIEDNGIFSIKKSDGTIVKKSFYTYNEAVSYLNKNAIPASETYKAANNKYYTIMFENAKVVIKKSDWSYAKQTFSTYAEAKTYLDKNAPKEVIKKKVVTTTKKATPLKTNITKKVTPVVKTTTPTYTPKVDTTTKAS